MLIGGDGDNLRVRHGDLRIKRGQLQMLLVFFRAVMAARKRQDEGIVTLKFAKAAQCARVIGQLKVRKNGSRYEVRTHGWTPSSVSGRLSLRYEFRTCLRCRAAVRCGPAPTTRSTRDLFSAEHSRPFAARLRFGPG